MKLQKGDKVRVLSGKDKGKEGTIEKVFATSMKAIVPGVNVYKRHTKARGEGMPGGIKDFTRALPLATLMLVCKHCGKPTRVGFEVSNKEKVRICKKCGKKL